MVKEACNWAMLPTPMPISPCMGFMPPSPANGRPNSGMFIAKGFADELFFLETSSDDRIYMFFLLLGFLAFSDSWSSVFCCFTTCFWIRLFFFGFLVCFSVSERSMIDCDSFCSWTEDVPSIFYSSSGLTRFLSLLWTFAFGAFF